MRWLCVFALAAAATVSRAQADDRKPRALALFADSDKAYKAGQFERAAELLRAAYDIYPEPILLYNLGRALESADDAKGAIAAYERYLQAMPDAKDRSAVEQRISSMKAQLAGQEAAQDREQRESAERAERERAERERADQERVRRASPPPPPAPRAQPVARSHIAWPWITLGVGVATLGGALGCGREATLLHDRAVAEPVQLAAQRLQDRAHSYAIAANVLYATGGALVAAALVWEVLDRRHPHDHEPASAHARLTIAPTAVSIGWAW